MNDPIEILHSRERRISGLQILLVAEDPGYAVRNQKQMCKDEGVEFKTAWIQKASMTLAGEPASSNETGK